MHGVGVLLLYVLLCYVTYVLSYLMLRIYNVGVIVNMGLVSNCLSLVFLGRKYIRSSFVMSSYSCWVVLISPLD